jgi:NAD(P)-dependent dehydrogenase (short-subunit alcohol dehydrogenase family)
MEINYIAPMRMYKAVLPIMHEQQSGLIINTSSVFGRVNLPFLGIYSASKHALEAASETMRYELSLHNIDSVCLEPGPFNTGLISKAIREEDRSLLKAYGELANVPGGMLNAIGDVVQHDPYANPQIIADKVLELIAMPYGKRPARVAVGNDFGCSTLNGTAESVQAGALAAMEMTHMDPKQKLDTVAA